MTSGKREKLWFSTPTVGRFNWLLFTVVCAWGCRLCSPASVCVVLGRCSWSHKVRLCLFWVRHSAALSARLAIIGHTVPGTVFYYYFKFLL